MSESMVTLTVNVFVNKEVFEDIDHIAMRKVTELAAEDAANNIRVQMARRFEDAHELAS